MSLLRVVIFVATLGLSFGFMDIYVGDASTKNYTKKPSVLNIGIGTKYIDLQREGSIIQSQSNMIADGITIALNTSNYSKFGISFYCGRNINASLVNANIDFTVKDPVIFFDFIWGIDIGVTGIDKNGLKDFYNVIEPKAGIGFNISNSFEVDGLASYQYYTLFQSQSKNPKNEAGNVAYSLIFKLSML